MIEDKWSNEPIKAEVIKTGEVVTGFTDGHGHFDVPIDHSTFVRYNLSEIKDDRDSDEERWTPTPTALHALYDASIGAKLTREDRNELYAIYLYLTDKRKDK